MGAGLFPQPSEGTVVGTVCAADSPKICKENRYLDEDHTAHDSSHAGNPVVGK